MRPRQRWHGYSCERVRLAGTAKHSGIATATITVVVVVITTSFEMRC